LICTDFLLFSRRRPVGGWHALEEGKIKKESVNIRSISEISVAPGRISMSPTRMSKIESAPRIALAFNDALNRRDLPALMALIRADALFEEASPAPDGSRVRGKDAIQAYLAEYFGTSPGGHRHVEDVLGFGRRCVLRWRAEWDDPRHGRQHLRGVDIFWVEDQLIRERLSYVKR
jgi:hypothetical protein